MNTLEAAIAKAVQVKISNNMPFATIWKVGKMYNFNFENYPVGYSIKEFGVKRTVLHVI